MKGIGLYHLTQGPAGWHRVTRERCILWVTGTEITVGLNINITSTDTEGATTRMTTAEERTEYAAGASMTAPISLIPRRTGAHRSSEKIASPTCQMSNVCCAMFNVVVKAPDDLLTRLPN